MVDTFDDQSKLYTSEVLIGFKSVFYCAEAWVKSSAITRGS